MTTEVSKFPFRNGTALFVTMQDNGPVLHIAADCHSNQYMGSHQYLGKLTREQALDLAGAIVSAYDPPAPAQTNEASKRVPFFLVWSPTGLRPPQYRHLSREGADTEAERLASSHAGGEFYTLAPVSMVKLPASPVREEYAYSTENDRPF